jgi:hypothetical protein
VTPVLRGFRTLVLCISRNALTALLPISRNAFAASLSILILAPASSYAQESKSASLAAELIKLMEANKLDSAAAKVGEGDQYVGALYFPGTQLLVVMAKYPSAPRMNYLLTEKNYKDMYLDLSSATDQKTRVFIMDLGANGLRFKRENNQPYDTVDAAGKSVSFDGEWGRAKISEEEYRKTYSTTDEQYAQMLQSLIAQLKKPS